MPTPFALPAWTSLSNQDQCDLITLDCPIEDIDAFNAAFSRLCARFTQAIALKLLLAFAAGDVEA